MEPRSCAAAGDRLLVQDMQFFAVLHVLEISRQPQTVLRFLRRSQNVRREMPLPRKKKRKTSIRILIGHQKFQDLVHEFQE